MRTKFLFIGLMLCCLLASTAFALPNTISKEEALAIAKQQFKGRDVDYYILEDDSVSNQWFFFVDAQPMKGWEHECYTFRIPKFVPVNYNPHSSIFKTRRKLPPTGNYVPLATRNRFGTTATSKPSVAKKSLSNEAIAAANRTYAIILSGGINRMSNYERYWNDCSFIYQTLVNKYGVPKENIFPLMSDGDNPNEDMRLTTGGYASQSLDLDNDGVNEIKLAATKSNIQTTLNTLKNKLQKDDHLFLYVIDHGGSTDNESSSYICLWNYENLYDYELAEMLTPFTEKLVNVNVVLGQCYSGGFNDDLTKVGCVVASACMGNESSWACSDIPYDEFVYHWTSAVNGATHHNVSVNADADNNGRVTMAEAFDYAKSNDRVTKEHPQYVSTPISVGEDLAFNNLAKSVDLYIKDNPEDTGKEPNMTTNEFWKSPSIWVRNQDDGIEIHENPVYSSDHLAAIVYVRIHNRGKEKYTGGQWLHVYWAKASTGFSDKAWKGRELYQDVYVTGGHLEATHIPEIEPDSSIIVKVNWALPAMMSSATDKEYHHFCLLSKIMDSHIDEKYEEGKSYFNIRNCNGQAQKNLSIIPKDEYINSTLVFVRNVNNQSKKYTLELVPSTESDEAVYDKADIKMELSPAIYNAWGRGGFKSYDIIRPSDNSNDTNLRIVKFISPQSKLENVSLNGDEFDVVSLKFDFNKFSVINKVYTFDLIQKDENGEIIGGETFMVESPNLSQVPLGIQATPLDNGSMKLSVDTENFEHIKWLDSQQNTIADSESIVVTPGRNNDKYTAIGYTSDGEAAKESISLDSVYGINSVAYSTESNCINVELKDKAADYATVSVISMLDGNTKVVENIRKGESSISISVPNFVKGIYVIVYAVDGVVVDERKINID